jgi:lipoic acid synthetase
MRAPVRTDRHFVQVDRLVSGLNLHTVCQSARCPNRHECWNAGTATLLLLGGVCTRHCRFCAVDHGTPAPPDPGEPARAAELARALNLRHVVLTSVTRDDLPDGGASGFAAAVRAIRAAVPAATIEVLTPDFQGDFALADLVLEAGPEVFNHNLETVERLSPLVRPAASYRRSLSVLAHAARRGSARVKSGLMLGLGETHEERLGALADLRSAGVEQLTLGQYLAPSAAHWPVAEFIPPDRFDDYARIARDCGFSGVESGPRVRSSYRAERMMRESVRV